MAEIYFVRHGESRANADGVIAGWLDSPLTENGVRQAYDEAALLVANNMQPDVIISSPLMRAYDTARIIARAISFPLDKIIVLDELREKGAGSFEGGAIDLLYAANNETMHEAGAESFVDFAERVRRANDAIKKHAGDRTLVVAYSGIYRMAQTLYEKLPPDSMKDVAKVPNGKLVRYPSL